MNEVYPLFSKPVFVSTPELPPFEEAIAYVKNLEYIENVGKNLTSTDTDVLSKPEFAGVRAVIQSALDEYTKGVMRWDTVDFYITQSWVNSNSGETDHHLHYHMNSIISGVFYLVAGDGKGKISFHDDHKRVLDFNVTEHNVWNSEHFSLPVQDNQIVLFPSVMLHSVEKHHGDYNRISIAFNTFVKGEFGSKQGLTHLKL